MNCLVDLPYPEVKVNSPNKEYANILLEDYSGLASELTSITQYSYQHFLNYPFITHIISSIAQVEMKHLELLGKTIFLLGEKPQFIYYNNQSNVKNYWQSNYINYTTDIVDMLKSDIILEQVAIRSYEKHKKLIKDENIVNLLERIILDEKQHLTCFYKLLNTVLHQNN